MLVDRARVDKVYESIKAGAAQVEGCAVVIFVAADVDAIAACRMLTGLLRADFVTHSVKPVTSYDDLASRFAEAHAAMGDSLRVAVLLNCGASVDLTSDETLPGIESLPAARVILIDAKRPFHLENVRDEADNVIVVDDGSGTPTTSAMAARDLTSLGEALADGDEREAASDEDSDNDVVFSNAAEEEVEAERRRSLNDGRYQNLSPRSRRGFRKEVRQQLGHYYRGAW